MDSLEQSVSDFIKSLKNAENEVRDIMQNHLPEGTSDPRFNQVNNLGGRLKMVRQAFEEMFEV